MVAWGREICLSEWNYSFSLRLGVRAVKPAAFVGSSFWRHMPVRLSAQKTTYDWSFSFFDLDNIWDSTCLFEFYRVWWHMNVTAGAWVQWCLALWCPLCNIKGEHDTGECPETMLDNGSNALVCVSPTLLSHHPALSQIVQSSML